VTPPSPEASAGDAATAPDAGTVDDDAGTVVDAAAAPDTAPPTAPQAVAVPMYVDPTASASIWSQVIGAEPTVGLLIANPNSGPGASQDSSYTTVISQAVAGHATIVGYVDTAYGGRSTSAVEADVDSWFSFYPAIEGIFFDDVTTDAATATNYYATLYAYVKTKAANTTVVLNPGTMPDEAYMSASDIIVSFEDTYANYLSYPPNPAWVASYSKWRFYNIILSASSVSDMDDAVSMARGRNVGYVYVTEQGPAAAYQAIESGSYWTSELAAVTAP
jgi:hypothetical protein